MAIERVTCFPNEGTPEVIPGDPQQGDIIRIVGTQNYQRYKAPRSYASKGTKSFKAIIRAKAKGLNKAGKFSESIALLKTIGE